MRSSLLFLACALFGVNGLAHGVARHGIRLNARGVRSAVLTMAEDPKVMFDQGHGWKPPKGGGGDPHGGAQFEATDTPDFFDESEESEMAGVTPPRPLWRCAVAARWCRARASV